MQPMFVPVLYMYTRNKLVILLKAVVVATLVVELSLELVVVQDTRRADPHILALKWWSSIRQAMFVNCCPNTM